MHLSICHEKYTFLKCHQTLKQIAMGSPLGAANYSSFRRVPHAEKRWETLAYGIRGLHAPSVKW